MAGVKRKADEFMEPDTDDVGPKQILPYDVSKEDSAKSVLASDEYNQLKKGIRKIAARLTEPLKKSEYKDAPSVKKLVEMTEARLMEDVSEPIMVSISGNMGSGKSTTINSIFSVGMIARSDNTGSSVTLVPHLYCGPLADQTHRFMIEVQFFNQQERKRFFEAELAAFYRAGCQDDFDDDEMSQRRPQGNDDDIDTRDTVTDALHSIFLEHRECQTKRDTRDFLKSAESENDENILKKLNKWADKLICRLAEDLECVMLEASTPQEMLKKVEMYSTELTDDDSQRSLSLWPLVRLIKVHFENPLSDMGVSILDAPGSSDNHIRRETALALKRQCSHAAIVVGAARANNEGIVSKEVSAAKGKGEGRIIVIVTGSDRIDPNTLVGGSSAERQEVERLKTSVERMQNENNALMLQVANSFDAELLRKKMHLDVRLHKEQNKERALRITMRSENTRIRLQEKLMDITDSQEPVPIISVSNTDYQKHLAGYTTNSAPTLSVAQTQIPEVRRQFARFPNEARLSEVKHLFKTLVPSAISRVNIFSSGSASDRKADIVAYVQRATTRYAPVIEGALDRLLTHFDLDVLSHLNSVEDAWMRHAEDLCDDWRAAYKASPFLALINRNGLKRHTKKSPAINLSGELVNILGGSMSGVFSTTVKKRVTEELTAIRDDLNDLLLDMRKSIKRDDSAALVNVQPFLDFVQTERRVVRDIITNRGKGFNFDLDRIKARFTTEVEDAYMAQEMLPVYEQVRKIKGGKDKIMDKPKIGWGAQRHLVFKQEVTATDGVWTNACMAMEHDFRKRVDSAKDDMIKAVGAVFDSFLSTFDESCDAADLDEETQKALQALLRTCLEEVDDFVKRELDPAWEALAESNR